MNWQKAVYLASLLVVGVLFVLIFYHPITTESEYSEVQWVQFMKTSGEWIAEFDIINHESRDMTYSINVVVDGKSYTDSILIGQGKKSIWIEHITPDELTGTEGAVTFKVYKEGWSAPIENVTWSLR